MTIISLIPNENNKHDIQYQSHRTKCWIENYIEVPSDLEEKALNSQGYCDLMISEGILTDIILKEIPINLTLLKNEKYNQISQTCEDTIHDGFQLETTTGVESFSLEEQDQTNLLTAYNAIQNGKTKYAYHANKTLCRIYTADEIKAIGDAATAHKLYHTTYCNHLFRWLDRVETKEELDQIYYGADLPEDLAANMQNVLTEMSEDSTVILNEETRVYSINPTP